MKYKVIKGIFKGHEFNGYVSKYYHRIIDFGTVGRSYPEESCICIDEKYLSNLNSTLEREEQLAEDNRISETMMAMNNPEFFEQ